ncbi:DNA-binding winged helix-turn-helix (wHTH) protein [Microbacterium endophyticum]|uniref:DNA-binding winged helix-turn-helix (WHTH) protein n=1 Tax=Microbacterium endophyticum TaxID=1526412 RepID=A0A7W4V353_9MICO|nr:winged helix-turn-helix domain-containing protein [Microbacterium endophyticum]MBB2975951.1 DNA-binding winged helix-turn-helix (wHTH) protein [Microbacterium endophyticum]NIK37680.1 DNA-binding winged helix-turn-helix (wHTH) protein [Microbacterium endophyticum]
MSNTALLERPATSTRPNLRVVTDSESAPAAHTPAAPTRALPAGTAPRGFALYVGFDEVKAAASGVSLGTLVEALRRTLGELAPDAETYATVALAPASAGGRNVDVVRLALHEPAATARAKDEPEEIDDDATTGVIVDISRKRVLIDGNSAAFTFKEFELLQYLVLREGRTIERTELVSSLWSQGDLDAPGERTIDVHVRRLRAKLGRYEDIVRTVRGVGYRFDRHADVVIRYGHGTPSPDRF